MLRHVRDVATDVISPVAWCLVSVIFITELIIYYKYDDLRRHLTLLYVKLSKAMKFVIILVILTFNTISFNDVDV